MNGVSQELALGINSMAPEDGSLDPVLKFFNLNIVLSLGLFNIENMHNN